MATTISDVLPGSVIGTAQDITTAVSGGTGKFVLISWDSIKEVGESDADGFEDVLKNILRMAVNYVLNHTKVANDGRTFSADIAGQGIDSGQFETGISKAVTTVAVNLYGSNNNPKWPPASDL